MLFKVIRVCFAGSQQNVTIATNGCEQLRVSSVVHRSVSVVVE